jgi:hypothetical protein
MKAVRTLPVVAAVMLVTACATQAPRTFPAPTDRIPLEQVVIDREFVRTPLTRESFGEEANKCVPPLNAQSSSVQTTLRDFPSRNIVSLGHVSSGSTFVVQQSTAICIRQSDQGHPIFAAEAFVDTVNPQGVPPDVRDAWYKQVAMSIASRGQARVAYTFPNGNAFVATYWVEPASKQTLNYTNEFKKQGEWEAGRFDMTFSHPALSAVSETMRGKQRRKHFAAERAL